MQKPWLKSYPDGVPEYINADEFSSVADLLNFRTHQRIQTLAKLFLIEK